LQAYLAGQSRSAEDALRFIADDAVFDVGRGRYVVQHEIRGFIERLRAVSSRTSVVELHEVSATEAVAVFEQRDDDLVPLGIDSIRLNVRVETIEALTAARNTGRTSEGIQLAERAGTLPPNTTA
jgi:hypothetical protein